jgi:hypothetical protein
MPFETSDCLQGFWFEDFELENPHRSVPTRCPVKGCSTSLVDTPYVKGQKPFCPKHGIRLHSNTFVYWNGPRAANGTGLFVKSPNGYPIQSPWAAVSTKAIEVYRAYLGEFGLTRGKGAGSAGRVAAGFAKHGARNW